MRIDDFFSFSGRFVARVSASVATVDRLPGFRVVLPGANTAFASVFVVPSGGDQGSLDAPAAATIIAQRAPPPTSTLQGQNFVVSTALAASAPPGHGNAEAPAAATIVAQRAPHPPSTLQGQDSAVSTAPVASAPSGQGNAEAPAAATIVAQRAPPLKSIRQGHDSAVSTDPAASTPSPPAIPAPPNGLPSSGRISTQTRRRTVAAAGSARPAVEYGFGSGGSPRQSARRAISPPRAPRPRSASPVVLVPTPAASLATTVPIPSECYRAEPVGTPYLRLLLPIDVPPVSTNDLGALGAAGHFQFALGCHASP